MVKEKTTSEGRTRNWTFIMYPDSAPENWSDLFSSECMKILVSPLHDADLNADDTEKKPHWHVVLVYDSVKTKKQAQEIADKVNGTVCKAVSSLRSLARYLCHLDNPEKAQYKTCDVLAFGGVDYEGIIQSAADIEQTLTQIEDFIDQQGILSYAALCRYARANRQDWTRVIRSHTFHLKAYVQACQWEQENGLPLNPYETKSDCSL